MALADLFRPKYKHSKSEVRAAAVAAMDKDDIELLIEVARQDRDSAIRKTAIDKIADPDTLADLASSQDDAKLREYTQSLAVDIWVAKAIHGEDEEIASESYSRAIELGGDRAIAEIAGHSQYASIRLQALAQIHDDKALGQVVRKSQRMDEWKDALSRIGDVQVLRGIAIDENRKQVAFAALEYIDDLTILSEIASKAKSKPVRAKAKRAKAAIAKAAAPVSTVSNEEKQHRAERTQIARTIDTLANGDEWIESRAQVDAALLRWEELGEGQNGKTIKKFTKALARYNKNHAQHGKAAREARERAIREVEQAERRERAALEAKEAKAAEDEEKASLPGDSPTETEATAPVPSAPAPVAVSDRDADKRLDNQDDLERLCENLEELLEIKEIRKLDRSLKEIDKAKRKIGGLPKTVEEALRGRYDEARRKAVIYLGDLREADDWKRWTTVPKMEALVVKAKEMLASEELSKLGDSLKKIQKEWRELGPAPREKGDELWKVFKATCDEVYEKVKVQRAAREEEQNENLVKKEALCLQAEELQHSTDWAETGMRFKEMQTEWKQIGHVPRRKSDGLWKRFRTACDAFFEARAPHLEDRFAEEAENLETKQALIAEIQGLADAEVSLDEIEGQISVVRGLQRRWRDIGKVAHKEFAALGDAYRAACDQVYGKRSAIEDAKKAADQELVASLETKIAECSDAGWDSDAAEIAKSVLDIRSTYLGLDASIAGYSDLGAKVSSLIRSQLEAEPAAYAGSVLDPKRSIAARKGILEKAEQFLPEEDSQEATAEEIAEKLRSALADRALGGVLSKTGGRSSQEIVADLKEEWEAISPVPGPEGTMLQQQFEKVCSKLQGTTEEVGEASAASPAQATETVQEAKISESPKAEADETDKSESTPEEALEVASEAAPTAESAASEITEKPAKKAEPTYDSEGWD